MNCSIVFLCSNIKVTNIVAATVIELIVTFWHSCLIIIIKKSTSYKHIKKGEMYDKPIEADSFSNKISRNSWV